MTRILIAFLFLLSIPAAADPLLYRIDDADSTVWLLGSVHALRADDYPLDARIESAYENAERVVLEVDPVELEPARITGLMTGMAQFENGSLSQTLSAAEYRELKEGLAPFGVDPAQLQAFEPWFVALQVFALNLARNGFAGTEGVDTHYATRAAADGKATGGLETAREQFELFDRMPMTTQKRFLLETVRDSEGFRAEMEKLVAMWRDGDTDGLEQLMNEEFAEEPALRRSMLDDRNRRWVEPVTAFLEQPGETLVVVGALHLVGEHGVIELLRDRGYDVERVGSD